MVDVRDASKLIGLYGKVNKIGGTEIYLKETFIPSIIKGLDKNTIPHEFGHSLGLPCRRTLGVDKKYEGTVEYSKNDQQ
ncbi:hypothetical protein [Pedobacter miscanthi]|uniref:hypothetical protein n=1 Tax=Pedobacter miscanthi TaxID=2259170 RepID=UPI00292E1EA7|nr:hypothetical protein [Pedobacter miscanthi]